MLILVSVSVAVCFINIFGVVWYVFDRFVFYIVIIIMISASVVFGMIFGTVGGLLSGAFILPKIVSLMTQGKMKTGKQEHKHTFHVIVCCTFTSICINVNTVQHQ